MPYVEGQLTFIDFLGYKPVTTMAKKRLFGGPYLTFADYCGVLASVYESSAIVGRARSDKLSIIEKIIEAQYPRFGPEPMKELQKEAKERLDEFKKERGREPHSFLEFIQVKQIEVAIQNEGLKGIPKALHNILYIEESVGHGALESLEVEDLAGGKRIERELFKKLMMKISLVSAEPGIRIFGREGIAFGSSFPKLTERMYRNLHENIEKPPVITLEEEEEDILQIVAVYTARFWPELLDALELRGHLEMVREEDR